MYRYIGNKAKLTPYILDKVHQMIGDAGTVADIMAGTGTVSLELRKKGYKVVASDVMTYSYHHLNVNLCMKEAPEFIGLKDVITDDLGCMYLTVLKYLNQLEPKKSFFYQEFSPDGTPRNGTPPRKYFTCLNKLGKILKIDIKLNKNYGEYNALMNFLTRTGMNLFDLINIHEDNFQNALDQIYGETNTNTFKDVLIKLRRDYSLSSNKKGKHTIRYILLNLREETLEFVLPNAFDKYCLSDPIKI